MVGIKAKFSISRDLNKLKDSVKKTKNDKRFLKFAANVILKRVQDNLKREGYSEASRFVKWKPLQPSTLKEKKRNGYSKKILERTGKMKKSFSYKIENDSDIKITSTKYMVYHQYGTKKMPKRKIVTFTKDDLKKIKEKFVSILKAKSKRKRIPNFELKPKIQGEFDDAK